MEVCVPERTLAVELASRPPGELVLLQGWVQRRRLLAQVAFLVLRDRSGTVQVVVDDPAVRAVLETTPEESVVTVHGTVVVNERAPGGVELRATELMIMVAAESPTPLELWRPQPTAGLPTRLDHAGLAWRQPAQRDRWRLGASALQGFRASLDGLDFTEVVSPKVVGTATESGANVFSLDWFGRPAYLAQSPQFYKQTLVGVYERVYEVGPVFRAEPHDTARHLASYTSLDVELGFVDDHRDVLAVLTTVLRSMINAVARTGLLAELPVVPETVPTLHFADALALVGAEPDEPDLAPAHERALGEWALREHGSDVLAVVGYPMAKRPFYTHPQPDDPRWSNSFDLIFGGVELVTGGQRLHRYEDYLAAITARGEDPAAYASYLEPFRYGMPPHGGFAIGLERFLARICGVENVREVTLFPRDLHRLAP